MTDTHTLYLSQLALIIAITTIALPSFAQETYEDAVGQWSEEPDAKKAPESSPLASDAAPSNDAKQNAIYARPFVLSGQRAALGGYAEANYIYSGEDGVNEGPGFEFRRFNLFVYSPIGRRITFLSELEFEHGTEEIALETALLDVAIFPELIWRSGILLTPLGAFNQAHDGPIWDFVDRPLVSTTIIPSTLSEVGTGFHGTIIAGRLDLDYQLYATQGLGDGIIDNDTGRASIPAGKDPALIAQDNNARPALSGRFATRLGQTLELGLSSYLGAYNTFIIEGEEVDDLRRVWIGAADYQLTTRYFELRGEAAMARIDIPDSQRGVQGTKQWGVHSDLVVPVLDFALWGEEATRLEVGGRFEYVDYNNDVLQSTGASAGDHILRGVGMIALRPGSDTVIRFNYSRERTVDLLRNPAAIGAAYEVGVATYF